MKKRGGEERGREEEKVLSTIENGRWYDLTGQMPDSRQNVTD